MVLTVAEVCYAGAAFVHTLPHLNGCVGITRRLAGIHFEGETKPLKAVIGDVEVSNVDGTVNALDRNVSTPPIASRPDL